MDETNDPLLVVDIATLEGYFNEVKRFFKTVKPDDRQKILHRIRNLAVNKKSANIVGFDHDLAALCRQRASLSRAELAKELGCNLHQQTLLKYEHGDFVPNPDISTGKKYIEWLSSHGYNPDLAKMRAYHSKRPRGKAKLLT